MFTPLRPRTSEAVFLIAILPRRLKLYYLQQKQNKLTGSWKDAKYETGTKKRKLLSFNIHLCHKNTTQFVGNGRRIGEGENDDQENAER
jgi:hypothetical protein